MISRDGPDLLFGGPNGYPLESVHDFEIVLVSSDIACGA